MSQYDNTNTGIMSKNDRKDQPNHPDYKGQININGKEFWLSGWIKERKDGTGKFMSLSFKSKDEQQQAKPQPAQQQKQRQADPFEDSEVPF